VNDMTRFEQYLERMRELGLNEAEVDECYELYEPDDRDCCGGRGCEVCEVYGG
jgi:hypothetical protein